MDLSLFIDASEFRNIGKQLGRFSRRDQHRIVGRTLGRMRSRVRTETVRRMSKDAGIPQKQVRPAIQYIGVSGDRLEMRLESGWMKLAELGGVRASRKGIMVRHWGYHKGAFTRRNKGGAFRRVGKSRFPIKTMWGPNPTNYVVKAPGPYQSILTGIVQNEFAPRLMHELTRAIGKLG